MSKKRYFDITLNGNPFILDIAQSGTKLVGVYIMIYLTLTKDRQGIKLIFGVIGCAGFMNMMGGVQ